MSLFWSGLCVTCLPRMFCQSISGHTLPTTRGRPCCCYAKLPTARSGKGSNSLDDLLGLHDATCRGKCGFSVCLFPVTITGRCSVPPCSPVTARSSATWRSGCRSAARDTGAMTARVSVLLEEWPSTVVFVVYVFIFGGWSFILFWSVEIHVGVRSHVWRGILIIWSLEKKVDETARWSTVLGKLTY